MKNFTPKPCKRCGTIFTPTNPCNTYCTPSCRDRNAYYWRVYGIGQDEYERWKEEQSHRCAICFGSGFLMRPEIHKEWLVVDHCHDTGTLRMLLCHNCNRALGLLKDDPSTLRRAADYIEAFREGATTIPNGSRAKWLEAHSPSFARVKI